MAKRFDVIVIGAGSGLLISSEAAARGLKVAVVEEGPFGGTCLNRGCIPSKMLIHSADVMETIKRSKLFGIKTKTTRVQWNKIMKRAWDFINAEAKKIEQANKQNKNITVYKTRAHFVGEKKLKTGKQVITADKIFICAGARPLIPPIKGLDKTPHLTSKEALRLKKQPKSMIIIGGGYIGAELAHFFGTLGTKITIVQRAPFLVNNEDAEIAQAFTKIMSKKHVVLTKATAKKVNKKGNKVEVTVEQNGKTKKLTAQKLLVATGRKPNTDLLKVENTGVNVDRKGFVKVNEFMETNVPGIYAIGDICGIWMFKHSANLEAQYAAHNAFNPKNKVRVDYTAMPHAVFGSPQIAGVGKTEDQLKNEGKKYVVGKYEYYGTGMGKTIEDKDGFVKVLVDPKTRKILGCHIIGSQASTLIHEVIIAMKARLGVQGITSAVHIHPALSEVVQRAFTNIKY